MHEEVLWISKGVLKNSIVIKGSSLFSIIVVYTYNYDFFEL